MKKMLLIICVVLSIVLGLEISYIKFFRSEKKVEIAKLTPTPIVVKKITKKTLFVPSWNLKEIQTYDEYDRLMYFGISATEQGINKSDEGYKQINNFLESKENINDKTYLVIKMIDSNSNQTILANRKLQSTIIKETMEIVKEKKIKGLALDLEISTLFNEDIIKQINTFVQDMYTSSKKYYIPFSVIIYGDVFYRKRPFDVDMISKYSDEIMIMAYDFHKSIGEPGPNFPLSKGRHYPYDFKTMINNYLILINPEKITVLFGMYGYEWIVDEKRRPVKPAKALTLKEIRKSFIEKCEWKECLVKRDPDSFETEVNYIDSQIIDTYAAMNMHVVWFEDEESVRAKTDYLLQKGITSIGYWVAGYF